MKAHMARPGRCLSESAVMAFVSSRANIPEHFPIGRRLALMPALGLLQMSALDTQPRARRTRDGGETGASVLLALARSLAFRRSLAARRARRASAFTRPRAMARSTRFSRKTGKIASRDVARSRINWISACLGWTHSPRRKDPLEQPST